MQWGTSDATSCEAWGPGKFAPAASIALSAGLITADRACNVSADRFATAGSISIDPSSRIAICGLQSTSKLSATKMTQKLRQQQRNVAEPTDANFSFDTSESHTRLVRYVFTGRAQVYVSWLYSLHQLRHRYFLCSSQCQIAQHASRGVSRRPMPLPAKPVDLASLRQRPPWSAPAAAQADALFKSSSLLQSYDSNP